ncbi:MAG: NADH:flavin oxidoreductase [Caldilineaceae bacterium]|nr:NADH:flavin oxidoreductase [Caldilineaceae bacterium]
MASYRRVAALKTPAAFQEHLAALGITMPFDEMVESGPDSPLAQPHTVYGHQIGNSFAVLPMEGWDAEPDGMPNDLVRRRWTRFGLSGAKLIWGCEATAVRPDGRANPLQLMILPETVGAVAQLREDLVRTHEEHYGNSDDLLIGLQLTHSGRFCKPNDKFRMEPRVAYRHPLLDPKFHIDSDDYLFTDDEIKQLVDDFIGAAKLAKQAGFTFVDVKHCHGYLGHEFLSAIDRPGPYGGSLENRTRFLREITEGIRAEVPGMEIGVRLSAIDFIPFQPGPDADRHGVPTPYAGERYPYAFGGDGSGTGIDYSEPVAFLDILKDLGIELVCITVGSPYYNPHIQRPAYFPPSDGYQLLEDPLVGVARQIQVVADLKRQRPDLLYVGSGYSYLQDWFGNVAQAAVRTGATDLVGIGRMVLSYPDICADILAGHPTQRKQLCRTFSDCTTAPRNGLISGCYPLDPFYKERPEAEQLKTVKG